MQAFPAIRSFDLPSLSGPAFFIPRPQLTPPNKLFFCRAKFAEPNKAGSHNFGVAPANLLVAEKESAKAVLTSFLKKRGFSKAIAARTVNKSALFIDHLVSRLHSVHKTQHLVGRELTTLEIRDALYPYLETLYEEFGDILVDVVEKFSNPPIEERSTENLSIPSVEEGPVVPVPSPITTLNSKKLKALAGLTDDGSTGKPPPHIIYLTELGMEFEMIKELTRKFPRFTYYNLEGKIKPFVELLLDLGIPKSDIPAILSKWPRLCRSKHLIPTVTFLKNLGMDKKQTAKAIVRFPMLLSLSQQKLKSNLDCLYELGLSTEKQGKVLMHCPRILAYRVEKIRAIAQYFHSIGANVGTLLHKCPQLFGLSIEANLKPVTQFLLERGFSDEEVAVMVSRFGNFYTLSLSNNIMPKWEFFLTMGYPKSELVKYPQYFGFSLEERIKPRYVILVESGVTMYLSSLLSLSDDELDKFLKRKMEEHVG